MGFGSAVGETSFTDESSISNFEFSLLNFSTPETGVTLDSSAWDDLLL